MKYNSGDFLYYVNPFVFIIEQIRVDFAYKEEDGTIFYIDHTGAYLRENELFEHLNEAQEDACNRLEKFYNECKGQIVNCKPYFKEEL